MFSYIINKGWRFKGDRMSDETFEMLKSDFADIKNSINFDVKLNHIVLTRGKQVAMVIDISGTEADWMIIKPVGLYFPFALNHIKTIKEWKKVARKI